MFVFQLGAKILFFLFLTIFFLSVAIKTWPQTNSVITHQNDRLLVVDALD